MNDTIVHECPSIFHDKRLRATLLVIGILLAAFLFAQTLKTFKEYKYVGGGVPAGSTISVQGEGEIFAVPDIATFSYSVIEEGATVQAAEKAATERTNKAKAALLGKGIEEKDIQTTGYDIHPKYSYGQPAECVRGICPPGEQKIIGYEAVQTDTVKVRKADTAGEVIAAVSGLGVQNVSGLIFTIDEEEAVKVQARDKAIKQAQEKASVLAKSLGVNLVRVVGFDEGGQGRIFYGMEKSAVAMDAVGGSPASVTPDISKGQNKIVSNVTITYEVR